MRFALQVGLTLRLGQRTLELVRELEDGHYVLEDVITRRPIEYTRQRLYNEIYSKHLLIVVGEKPREDSAESIDSLAVLDVSSLTKQERSQLEYRLKFVKALSRHGIRRGQRKKVEQVIKNITSQSAGCSKQPSATTVMLWARKYQNSGLNPLSLVDRHRLRRTRIRLANPY